MADLFWYKASCGSKIRNFGLDMSLNTSRSTVAGSKVLLCGPLLQPDRQTNIKELSEGSLPKGSNYLFPVKRQELALNTYAPSQVER